MQFNNIDGRIIKNVVTSPFAGNNYPKKTTFYTEKQSNTIIGFNKPNFDKNVVTKEDLEQIKEFEQPSAFGNSSLVEFFLQLFDLHKEN